MKVLLLNHPEMTRQSLLAKADSIPGAWIGIRLAALLLWLPGWKSTAVSELFGVSRWAVCQWIGLANEQGLSSIQSRPAPGRKPRLSAVAYARQWTNLRPDVETKSIDMLPGEKSRGTPVLLAVTAATAQ